MATEFGSRLSQARAHAKLSQKALAKKVGMGQGTLSELETGGFGSSFTVQIAEACGVNSNWLATGEGHMLDIEPNRQTVTAFRAREEAAPSVLSTLQRIGQLLAGVSTERREALAGLMSSWAKEGGHDMYPPLIESILTGRSAATEPSKGTGT